MHFTICFLALFFLPAFAQLQPFIPLIGTFLKPGASPAADPNIVAVVLGYQSEKIIGAFVYPPDSHSLPTAEWMEKKPMSEFYTSSLEGYTVVLVGRVINMNFALKKNLEPMSPENVEKLKSSIADLSKTFVAGPEPPNIGRFLNAAQNHAHRMTATSGTAASNTRNKAMRHGSTRPPCQRNTGPPTRFQAAVQGANTGPGPGNQASTQSGTIETSSSGNHDKAVASKPSSPSPAGQNAPADPQVHATTNVQTSSSGSGVVDTRTASQSNTGRQFQFGTIGASTSSSGDVTTTRPTSPGQSNAGPRQFQFGTIEPSSSGKDVTHMTTTPKLTSPGQRNVGPPSQVHASAPGPQVGTNFDPNAPSSSDPILRSNIRVHPGFGHDLQ